MPRAGAAADEIGQTLAALLGWIVKARLADLLDAGLTHADVFKLVRVADDYRKRGVWLRHSGDDPRSCAGAGQGGLVQRISIATEGRWENP